MNTELRINLSLEPREYICGESIFFDVSVTHTFNTPLSVASFDESNRSLTMVLKTPDGRELTADQMSRSERDGFFDHEPGPKLGLSLEPGKSLNLRGDLLSWFGRITPGEYMLSVMYQGIMREAESAPVRLRVLPAAINMASVSKCGCQQLDLPFNAAFSHKQPEGFILFFQQQSPYLPRNPWKGIRTALVKDTVTVDAACSSTVETPSGHLYWQDRKDKLYLAPVDLEMGQIRPPVEVRVPFKGHPLRSSLSAPKGTLLMPFADHKNTRLVLLEVEPNGQTKSVALDLGKVSPIGPYVCFWEYDVRLLLAWVTPNGRQVEYAMLPLEDISAGFATRPAYISNDPVIWLDAYLDEGVSDIGGPNINLPDDDESEEEEMTESPPPKLMFWCVSKRPGRIVCMRVGTSGAPDGPPISFDTSDVPELRVIDSAVTSEYDLALLLADSNGRLYYASTIRKSLQPLENLVKMKIGLKDYPALMKGSEEALAPWVHLRWVSDGKLIEYVRLEPEDEFDAVEEEAQSSTAEFEDEEEEEEEEEEEDEPQDRFTE